jgi:malate synthase
MIDKGRLKVARALATFVDDEALPGTGIDPGEFWAGTSRLFVSFTPENRALLQERQRMQLAIDAWHEQRCGHDLDGHEYLRFLRSIDYLVDEPSPFRITTENVDSELATIAGPQLVVPASNARFVLNAANARWGSLYDALYGTDVLGSPPLGGKYDATRGAEVIARTKKFLDETVPLASGSHAEVSGYTIRDGVLHPALVDPAALAGWQGDASNPSAILFRHHGLHIELIFDRSHPIGSSDRAGIADVVLESALSTIVDLEDSVAAVDALDKVGAYRNWLGLMRGDLEATVERDARRWVRSLKPDRAYSAPNGARLELPGRSLLLVRNVGHLMTTPAVLLED